MMRVGDGDRERIGSIGTGNLRAGKQARDHRVYLYFLSIAVAHDRFLDQPCGIFTDVNAGARRAHQNHTPRLAELQRRLRVLVDEDFLGGRRVRTLLGDQLLQLFCKRCKPLGKGSGGIGLDLPAGNVREAISLGFDQAPAGGAEAWIEPEDPQASFSNSSSGPS